MYMKECLHRYVVICVWCLFVSSGRGAATSSTKTCPTRSRTALTGRCVTYKLGFVHLYPVAPLPLCWRPRPLCVMLGRRAAGPGWAQRDPSPPPPPPRRIGRTGRSGKTGVATTFVNTRQCEESILLDLKHLLREAKQRVPQFLLVGGFGLGRGAARGGGRLFGGGVKERGGVATQRRGAAGRNR